MNDIPSFAADERIPVAVAAVIELDGIFETLIGEGQKLAESLMVRESATIKALAIRGKRLANAALAVLDDELESVERCRRIVDVDGLVMDDPRADEEVNNNG